MFHYIFFIFFSFSLIFSQDCGDSDCDEASESYINCIDDCPITTDILVSIDDYSAHIDSQYIIISIDVDYLENVEAILFNLSYDESMLSIESPSDCYINQNFNSNNINFFVNATTLGNIQGVLYTFEDLVLNGPLIDIRFKINDGLFLGTTSDLEFISFIINNTEISDYSQDGMLTIGSSGCTDLSACNYDSSVVLDDGTCAYEYDCAGECGGDTIEDCAGECGGATLIDDCGICDGELTLSDLPGEPCDCNGQTNDVCGICGGSLVDEAECCDGILDDCGVCNGDNDCLDCNDSPWGDTIVDDCGVCGGDMFPDSSGIYPDGTCDCLSMLPTNYCIDFDGDGASDSDPVSSCYNLSELSMQFIECATLNLNINHLNDYKLLSLYPNPFNPSLTINYKIANIAFVDIKVLDINGRHVENLISDIKTPGIYSINWEPKKNLSSGIYLLEFKYNNYSFTKKINYIK